MAFQRLNGFRDLYPADARKREHLFHKWKQCARRHGFAPYDGPPLESLDLYKKKSGDEIVGQLYHFTDKGEREVALRPEMTPTLARMVGAVHRDYKKPLKWFSIPQVFRYERPQKGRLREHYQWNCDIIGEAGPGADAELLAVLIDGFRSLGLGPDHVVLRLSDRRIWSAFMDQHHVVEDQRYEFLQTLDKMERTPEAVTREKLGPLADEVRRTMDAAVPSPELEEILARLDAMGLRDFVKIDLSIVRGLAYYTGVVFEAHERSGNSRAIAGGGRYDHLLQHLAGQDLPALGFGMGDVVITDILDELGLWPSFQDDEGFYLVSADDSLRDELLRLAAILRTSGYRVDYALSTTKVGKQFESAADRGFARALVLDPRWPAEGVCGLKTLATREQTDVRLKITNGKLTSIDPLQS